MLKPPYTEAPMKRCLLLLVLAFPFALGVASCVAGNSAGADAGDAFDGGDAGPPSLQLIASTYNLAPFSEMWQCERVNVTADVWVTRFTPNSPPGTHHEVLAIDPTPTTTGTSNCNVSIERDWTVIFASGVGSPSLDMPPGVAFRIPAGSQIVLDLHLLNATTSTITGTSSIDVTTAAP